MPNQRGAANRCPFPADRRCQLEARFIDENQVGAQPRGVFLSSASGWLSTAGWLPRCVPGRVPQAFADSSSRACRSRACLSTVASRGRAGPPPARQEAAHSAALTSIPFSSRRFLSSPRTASMTMASTLSSGAKRAKEGGGKGPSAQGRGTAIRCAAPTCRRTAAPSRAWPVDGEVLLSRGLQVAPVALIAHEALVPAFELLFQRLHDGLSVGRIKASPC